MIGDNKKKGFPASVPHFINILKHLIATACILDNQQVLNDFSLV